MIRNSILASGAVFLFVSAFIAPELSSAGQHTVVAPLSEIYEVVSGTTASVAGNSSPATDAGLSATQELSAPATYSGSWYNPDRDGEGFEFQALDNGGFLVIWYAYPGISDNDLTEQTFILGTGTIENDTATILGAYKSHGPVLGYDYDKDDLEIVPWGDITINFFDENTATVDYNGTDGSGATDVKRLTRLADPGSGASLPPGMSAVWYDPETNGQGWFVEILPNNQALVYWFTYDENGNQAWSLGVGDIAGTTIQVPEMLAGKGARFGDEFNSDDVTLELIAQLSLEFENCNAGKVTIQTADGSLNLSYPVVRLTVLLGHDCSWLPPDPNTRVVGSRFFFIATSASDSSYFRDLDISWDTSTQHIIKVDIDSQEATEVDSNFSPSYAQSTIYSYTVDDRYYVRKEYDTQHNLVEYDPLTLVSRSQIRVNKPVDRRCSAITHDSYFYRVKVDHDPFFGDTGGEFMRLNLVGNSNNGIGVQVPQNECYYNLDSSNGVLYDAIYLHEFDGTTAGIGLYTRDPDSGVATTIAEFLQPDANQFTSLGYSFHFDGNTVFIIREKSAGGFQVLRYIHGIDTGAIIVYNSGSDIPADFYPSFRDADDGFVAIGDGSGLIVLLDLINFTAQYFDIATNIYDLAFLHVPD